VSGKKNRENSDAADFIAAIKKGIAACLDGNRVRAEVGDVLAELARELYKASGEWIIVSVVPRWRKLSLVPPSMAQPGDLAEGYEFSLAVSASENLDVRHEIATIELGEKGYPMAVKYAREENVCRDRASLVSALERMLADHNAGGILNAIWPAEKR
jgi:hypothetical protein